MACVWSSRVSGSGPHLQRTLPDGCVEIVYAGEQPALLYGPDGGWANVRLENGARYRGVRLKPGAAREVLKLDVQELAGRVVQLEDVMSRRALDYGSPAAWTATLLAQMARVREGEGDGVAIEAARRMAGEPRLRVSDLARRLDISERQLRRRFERTIGLPPSTYARIARMQRAVRSMVGGDRSWTESAYEAGFSDQAHLTREIKQLTGYTPSRLVTRRDGYASLERRRR